MTRPTGSDPTPGSPWGVRSLSARLGSVGDDAADAERGVRSLAGDQAVLSWVGLTGDVFRGAIDDFPGQLQKLADSFHRASSALGSWASDLEGAQSQADRALVRGRAARARLDSLQGQLSGAQGSLTTASSSYDRLHNPPAGGTAPDPDQVRSALRSQQAAASRVSGLQSQVGDASGELELAKRLARDATELRDGAADRARSRIHDAADAGIKPNSFWEDFTSAVSKVWHVVVVIAKVTVAVLGVVALIIGGPLAWVVFAAALVLLADSLMKYANGEGSVWEVGLAALGCIPGTKGLTTLGELSAAFRAGGMLGAGAHVLGAGRTAVTEMAASVRAMGAGARMFVRRLASTGDDGAGLVNLVEDVDDVGDVVTFLNHDRRLGPDPLPDDPAVLSGLQDYDRLAGRTPEDYLDGFYDAPGDHWDWPGNDGFAGDRAAMAMKPGETVDRFGPPTGRYLSPGGTTFPERALPPDSLNPLTVDGVHVSPYAAYEVVKPFDAQVGYVAPAFGQPGGGLQIFVDKDLLGTGDRANVQWLLDHGYLKPVAP
jgi:Tuberculosis necrotizing toxin